jgi:hypothetical protein
MATMVSVIGEQIVSIARESTGKIRSINQKYANPKIQLSGGAKLALFLLELYLIFLVGLLAFKFWTIIRGGAL